LAVATSCRLGFGSKEIVTGNQNGRGAIPAFF
jgi:hypothetical protein